MTDRALELAEKLRECMFDDNGFDTARAAEMIREWAATHDTALREKARALVEEFRKWEHYDTLAMIADEVQALAELLEEPCQKK